MIVTDTTLKARLQIILEQEDLEPQRAFLKSLADELNVSVLDYAAAMLFLNVTSQQKKNERRIEITKERITVEPHFKMQRYRLDVGYKQGVSLDELKRILVEESGVDKNNIQNVSIRQDYTMLDLPDEMPADIFLHLKNTVINQRKLNIKRVIKQKNGNKKIAHPFRFGKKKVKK